MAALISYYSRAGENYFSGEYLRIPVGNTEKSAGILAELTGGRLYKIEQAQPYSEDYQTCIAEAKADLQKKARPEVLNLPADLDGYDEIYLGYPNYWGHDADGGLHISGALRLQRQDHPPLLHP